MGRESRNKGRRGEAEVVKIAKERGLPASRTAQLQAGGLDYSDVVVLDRRLEVKRCETIEMPKWLRQVAANGSDGLAFRRSKERWHVVIPLEVYLELLALDYPDA